MMGLSRLAGVVRHYLNSEDTSEIVVHVCTL